MHRFTHAIAYAGSSLSMQCLVANICSASKISYLEVLQHCWRLAQGMNRPGAGGNRWVWKATKGGHLSYTLEMTALRPLKPFDRNITMLESGPPDYDWAWDSAAVPN
ncbi:hypothetical protein N6H05_02585 [Sphingobium sp. WTD-1]|uniref:hypothetical protein n=1 Tax=Sphingobium sp. WTD-1 TaxID=2979467 RepID=UPI0024DE4F7D|nr:hypothetical protein [Sphingobium sp. WTD-1]WIA56727.1 hypothetical protein N6H05_02585 [Sphingobium sp. WTD-1]